MKKRAITPRLFKDKRVATMGLRARWLFVACIANADDEGRVEGEAALLRAMAFPHDDGMSLQAVEDALAECTRELDGEHPLLVSYMESGERFLWLPGFTRHQTLRYRATSRLPAPPAKLVRKWGKTRREDGRSPGATTEKDKREHAENERRERYVVGRSAAIAAALKKMRKPQLTKIEKDARAKAEADGTPLNGPLGETTLRVFVHDLINERVVHFPAYEEWDGTA